MRRIFLRISVALFTFLVGALPAYFHHQSKAPLKFGPAENVSQISAPIYKCDKDPKLPIRIKVWLDRNFPGWQFHKATNDDCEWVKTSVGPYAYPEMIQGDWDGNGQLDYAIMIDYYKDTYPATLENGAEVAVVAFLATKLGCVSSVVTHRESTCLATDVGYLGRVVGHGDGFLLLMPRGSRDYDYGAQSEFVYQNDTISAGTEKGGMSYLYENGKFRAIISSD